MVVADLSCLGIEFHSLMVPGKKKFEYVVLLVYCLWLLVLLELALVLLGFVRYIVLIGREICEITYYVKHHGQHDMPNHYSWHPQS